MILRIVLAALFLLVATNAHAQTAGTPVDDMVQVFRGGALQWQAALQSYAFTTFYILATIELVWALTKLAIAHPRADVSDLISTLINEIMFIGLFYWLLSTTTLWGPMIIESFGLAAQAAGGVQTITPGAVVDAGINVGSKILDAMRWWEPKSSFVLAVAGIIDLVCFAYVAAAMVIALVESWWIIGSSVLFMAFGASRWTNDIAVGVIRHIFGLGTRLFALQLIAAFAVTLGNTWVGMVGRMDVQEILLVLACSLILLAVAWEVPKSMERMVRGTSTTGPGGLIGAGAGAIGAGVGIGRIASAAATGMAGAGVAVGESIRLSAAQNEAAMAQSNQQQSGLGRMGSIAGGAVRNIGEAALNDVGGRLSGTNPGRGQTPWRMQADMAERRRIVSDDLGKPPPPSTPMGKP